MVRDAGNEFSWNCDLKHIFDFNKKHINRAGNWSKSLIKLLMAWLLNEAPLFDLKISTSLGYFKTFNISPVKKYQDKYSAMQNILPWQIYIPDKFSLLKYINP